MRRHLFRETSRQFGTIPVSELLVSASPESMSSKGVRDAITTKKLTNLTLLLQTNINRSVSSAVQELHPLKLSPGVGGGARGGEGGSLRDKPV